MDEIVYRYHMGIYKKLMNTNPMEDDATGGSGPGARQYNYRGDDDRGRSSGRRCRGHTPGGANTTPSARVSTGGQ